MSVVVEPTLMAESLIDVLASAGLVVVARANQRIDPRGSVTKRVVFVLSVVSFFFFVRALGWLFDSDWLGRVATMLAGATPLAGLLVVEGLLRRHSPPFVKMSLSLGAIAIAVMTCLNWRWTTLNQTLLFVLVVGGYSLLAWLLVTRDKPSLTSSENRSIRRLLIAAPFLLALLITDFRGLIPIIPLRLAALGVLLLIYSCFGADGLSAPGKTRVLKLLGFLAITALLACGFALTQNHGDGAGDFEIAAVIFSGLVLAGLVSEEIGARSERSRPLSPLLRASDPAEFETALRTHHILQDAKILERRELRDVDDPALLALLKERPVLRRQEAPWRLPSNSDGVERAVSLLSTYDATHLMRLGSDPLRIAVFTVPTIADDPRTEIEIVIAQRMGEALYRGGPTTYPSPFGPEPVGA
jgi:hypothetical protein